MNASILQTIINRVRAFSDDGEAEAKFTNAFLIEHCVGPAMVDVLARLNLSQDNPVLLRTTISIVAGTPYYQLPPSVQEVHRLFQLDPVTGIVSNDSYPLSSRNPRGPLWRLEGNTLVLDPPPTTSVDCFLEYVPSGDFIPCKGTGTVSVKPSTTTHRIALQTSPALGALDRRPNAYAGQILRLIPASGLVEERLISTSYLESGTWYADVRVPFAATGTFDYEVAPQGIQGLVEAIAWRSALKLAVWRKETQSRILTLTGEYRSAMKTITDNWANLQMRIGKGWDKGTLDNPLINPFGGRSV